MTKTICFSIFLTIICTTLFSNTYYVSNNGNDKNNGKSPEKAFRTIEKINNLRLRPGDKVLFRKGDVFSGELLLKYSGKKGKPIVISSYGEGEKPIFSGAVTVTGWESEKARHYHAKTDYPIKQLYVNNKLQTIARYPDEDYLRIDKNDSTYLFDKELTKFNYDITGATLRVLTCNWQWEIRKIIDIKADKMILDSVTMQPYKKDFSYYIEGKEEFLSRPGEWVHSPGEKTIQLISEVPPSNAKVEATVYNQGILLTQGTKFIHIEGLAFQKYNNAGIDVQENASDIVVENNSFTDIEVFGIRFQLWAKNCTVKGNMISDLRGRGIAMYEPQNCIITKNTVKRIGLIHGYGFDGVNNGSGITIENREVREKGDPLVAKGNTISYNSIDSTGYGGIRADGCNSIIEYNVVKNAVLTMNDGGGIYCWAKRVYNYTYNNIFRNNIVINVPGNTYASAGDYNMTCCFYMDNFTNNIVLENNIAIGSDIGYNLNDHSYKITLRGNLSYNNRKGIVYAIYFPDSIHKRGNTRTVKNTIYCKKRDDRAIKLDYRRLHNFDQGVIDSNLYINPSYAAIIERFEEHDGIEFSKHYELWKWQEETGWDANSKFIGPKEGDPWWEMEDNSEIFVNETAKMKTIYLENRKYTDIFGKEVNELKLEPYSAEILIQQF